jgi:predicted HAD superfamily Cof-like phosphohydrolase
MPDLFQDQKKFMTVSGQTTDEFNDPQYAMYLNLIREEVSELEDAVDSDNRVEQLDALIDILVVTVGAVHSLGVDAEGAWKEVLRSNLAKVDPASGRVLRREDGKILKPANWEPPRLDRYVKS